MNDRLKFRIWDGEKFYFTTDEISIYPAGFSDTFGLFFGVSPNERLKPDSLNYSKDAKITIQQWTGLTDSTGKEIYEGDICLYRKQYREVRIGEFWDGVDDRVGVFLQDPKVIHRNFGTNKLDSISSCEVFGNIFETPELLA